MCQVQYLVGRAGQTVLTARCGKAGALGAGGGGGHAVLGGPGGRTRESYASMRCPRVLKLSSAFQLVDNLGLDVLVWAPIKH